jgi:hypothetical protein
MSRLPGLDRLWALTRGSSEVRIAVLDGPADAASLAKAAVTASGVVEHGTHVQSIITGSSDAIVPGLAPGCTVFSVPIFDGDGEAATCTQERLAEGIYAALERRANIINISAAQQADLLQLSGALNAALQAAQESDVLIVAATGNHGCACDTIPASVPGVLAVGAHGPEGAPLLSSNWGPNHRAQGLTAPGRAVAGACVGGGLCRASGTSFAAATVSGVAGLLMSVDVEAGLQPSGARIRKILLGSTVRPQSAETASSFLGGRLDAGHALDRLKALTTQGEETLSIRSASADASNLGPVTFSGDLAAELAPATAMPAPATASRSTGIAPAHEDCGCGGSGGACSCHETAVSGPQLVYAIGRLGVSYVSEARRDSIWRILNARKSAEPGDKRRKSGGSKSAAQEGADDSGKDTRTNPLPLTDDNLRALLEESPYLAQSIAWTLSRGDAPMYAIVPAGAFAADAYAWLADRWHQDAEDAKDTKVRKGRVDFVAIPGVLAGKLTLYDGTKVDAIIPDLRGMVSWSTKEYVNALIDALKSEQPGIPERKFDRDVSRFLDKIYFSISNRGLSARERAINAAATNAFNFGGIFVEAGAEGLSFRDVAVERSPFGRPGSDSYDVLLTFFDPARRLEKAPLRTRLTIDVSDAVPVVVGEPQSWFEY